ncbi:MAG TPA: copper resistance protein CopC [Sphingomicrobium sp.]
MRAVQRVLVLTIILSGAPLASCAAQSSGTADAAVQPSASSILKASRPAAGSAVAASVDSLDLHFDPPARLDEVTLEGDGGTMPMMVHSVGEVADYSIPLPGLDAGHYAVNWRATARGRQYRGAFTFTVR